MSSVVPIALAVAGTASVLAGLVSLRRRARDRELGELVAVDAGPSRSLRSARYRLAGRPDAVRRRRDGSLAPIELKHRPAPRGAPYPSHVVQLEAYCLLLEEETARAPPFGILRYTDRDVRLPWDAMARRHVVELLAELRRPYDGRADPGPAKCGGCTWSGSCDASLARPAGPRHRARRTT